MYANFINVNIGFCNTNKRAGKDNKDNFSRYVSAIHQFRVLIQQWEIVTYSSQMEKNYN